MLESNTATNAQHCIICRCTCVCSVICARVCYGFYVKSVMTDVDDDEVWCACLVISFIFLQYISLTRQLACERANERNQEKERKRKRK